MNLFFPVSKAPCAKRGDERGARLDCRWRTKARSLACGVERVTCDRM